MIDYNLCWCALQGVWGEVGRVEKKISYIRTLENLQVIALKWN